MSDIYTFYLQPCLDISPPAFQIYFTCDTLKSIIFSDIYIHFQTVTNRFEYDYNYGSEDYEPDSPPYRSRSYKHKVQTPGL